MAPKATPWLNPYAPPSPDDVVIVYGKRTPLCKSFKGGLKDTTNVELQIALYKSIIPEMGFDPALVEDVVVGQVQPLYDHHESRPAAIAGGFPATTPVLSINRQCASGLMAVKTVADNIRSGTIDIGLAVGSESISTHDHMTPYPMPDDVMNHPVAKDCQPPQSWTTENIAREFSITREAMDRWAYQSHSRASAAQKNGLFREEIISIQAYRKNAQTGQRERIVLDEDDGIRHNTTYEGLAKIKPAFPQYPPAHATGGNSSQITDGAAAVVLMRRSKAEELGLKPLARYVTATTTGHEPRLMPIGPSYSIPRLMDIVGLKTDDIEVFELNEAFASMMVYTINKLNLDPSRVNPRGGAIALGHPFGATGVRQIVTGLAEMKQRKLAGNRKSNFLVTAMCIGQGMGAASLIVDEQ